MDKGEAAFDAHNASQDMDSGRGTSSKSKIMALYTNSWFQLLLISFICFCLPGVSLPAQANNKISLNSLSDVQRTFRAWR